MLNFVSRNQLQVNLNLTDPRLTNQYGTALSATVNNPFFNYGTEATFPGALRRQARVSIASLLKPYPQYGDILQTSTDVGKFQYRSLQIRLQRPIRQGISFLLSYAYNIEKSQVFYDTQDEYDGALVWQNTTNPRHRIVATSIIKLPVGRGQAFGANMPKALDLVLGGWQSTVSYRYRSGQFLRFGAMLAPESVQRIGETGRDKLWFDTAGFTVLPAFTRRKNPWQYDNLTGPIFSNLDATISKKFNLRESFKLEFRLEAYNALNGMNWANPNTSVTSSDFGRTFTQAGNHFGRRLQYMFRLEF